MGAEPVRRRNQEGLAALTALDMRDRLARGEVDAEALAEACLARIAAREPAVGAFAFLDPEAVLAEARARDALRRTGRPIGPLHGVPVAVKDIIDTQGWPTENGTALDAGRRPARDAAVVARLKAAGAVIVGKTVTTELAYFHPAGTSNPHAPDRTPGGSSSGSAAAVAAGMVPLAIGTQTAGSVIRPASFCGVVGFKPTYGMVPRTGILRQAPPLDTVGVFARSVEDAALLADALAGHDPGDADSLPIAAPLLLATAAARPPVRPDIAFVRGPDWDRADPATRQGLEELAATLGPACDMVELPDIFAEAGEMHRRLILAGFARHLRPYHDRGADRLSPRLRAAIEEGRTISAVDYLAALDWREVLNAGLERLFERYDAILAPAAIGEAPLGLGATGDPVFAVPWTLCGVPAISLPLMEGPNGLPVGVQLVGRRHHDGRLLRTARWVWDQLAADGGAP